MERTAPLLNDGSSSTSGGSNRSKAIGLIKAVLAETFGCFLLLFTVACLSASGDKSLLNFAVTAAFCVTTIILTIGHISGAHINPAITLGFAVSKHFPWRMVPLYVTAQVLGATLGTFAAKAIYGVHGGSQLAVTRPLAGTLHSLAMETLMSFVMVFLACNISTSTAQLAGPAAALGVPATVGLSVMVAAPVSSGSLNPARSLGPAFVANSYTGIWIYVIGPCAGAVLGALTHKAIT